MRTLVLSAIIACSGGFMVTRLAGAEVSRGGTVSAAVPAAGVSRDEAEIRAVIQRMQDAWNRGDFRGYMNEFKNPDVIFASNGRFQHDWQATLDHYVRAYGAPGTRGVVRFYDVHVEMLAPDAAMLTSHFHMTRAENPQEGVFTDLMRKVNGKWVVALNHVSAFVPGAARTAAR